MSGRQQLLRMTVALVTLLFFTETHAQAAELQLSWIAPLTSADSTPLTDLAGYLLYYGQRAGQYDDSIDVGNRTTYTLSDLESGRTYYISVTAYDTSGNESDHSNEVVVTVRASCLQTGFGIVFGRVATGDAGTPNVALTLHGPGGCTNTTTTNTLSVYRFHGVGPGDYMIVPASPTCTFTPASQVVELTGGIAWAPFRATCS